MISNLVILRHAIAQLPEAERKVFLLRQNAGLPYDEISRQQQRPVEEVKDLMRRALHKLRDSLLGPEKCECPKSGRAEA